MSRCVVSVATGRYVPGTRRLLASPFIDVDTAAWFDEMPPGSPSHLDVPYAFKAHALDYAAKQGASTLLWADACILPIRSLEPLWDKIEADGAWIGNNGWTNAEWTCDSAYADLGVSREQNEKIPHVVATTFGLNLEHPVGKAIFNEYLRLAKTDAFKGPWWNSNHPEYRNRGGAAPCGPPTTRGHRHDQAALSLLAWRYGAKLTNSPEWFSYRGGETESTMLVADATY